MRGIRARIVLVACLLPTNGAFGSTEVRARIEGAWKAAGVPFSSVVRMYRAEEPDRPVGGNLTVSAHVVEGQLRVTLKEYAIESVDDPTAPVTADAFPVAQWCFLFRNEAAEILGGTREIMVRIPGQTEDEELARIFEGVDRIILRRVPDERSVFRRVKDAFFGGSSSVVGRLFDSEGNPVGDLR